MIVLMFPSWSFINKFPMILVNKDYSWSQVKWITMHTVCQIKWSACINTDKCTRPPTNHYLRISAKRANIWLYISTFENKIFWHLDQTEENRANGNTFDLLCSTIALTVWNVAMLCYVSIFPQSQLSWTYK